jgi:hypothetical protein
MSDQLGAFCLFTHLARTDENRQQRPPRWQKIVKGKVACGRLDDKTKRPALSIQFLRMPIAI